jgi:hypothetical protein
MTYATPRRIARAAAHAAPLVVNLAGDWGPRPIHPVRRVYLGTPASVTRPGV